MPVRISTSQLQVDHYSDSIAANKQPEVVMNDARDAALEAELDFARLLLATAKTPGERRDAWNAICELQDERAVLRDYDRGQGLTEKARG